MRIKKNFLQYVWIPSKLIVLTSIQLPYVVTLSKKLIWLVYAVYLTQPTKLQQVRLNLFILLMIVARRCLLEANVEVSTYIFVPFLYTINE